MMEFHDQQKTEVCESVDEWNQSQFLRFSDIQIDSISKVELPIYVVFVAPQNEIKEVDLPPPRAQT